MSTIRELTSSNGTTKYQAIVRVTGYTPKYKTFKDKSIATEWADTLENSLKETTYKATDAFQLAQVLNKHTSAQFSAHSDLQTAKQRQLNEMLWTSAVERYIVDINQYHNGYANGDKYRARALMRRFEFHSVLEITPEAITEYKEERLHTVSTGSVKRELGYIQRVLSYLRKELHLSVSDVFSQVRIPKDCEPRERIPSIAEYNTIVSELQQLRSPVIADLVILARETAMRRSEMIGIHEHHLNTVTKTLFIPITKTDKARTIPLTPIALELLCRYAEGLSGTERRLFTIRANSITTAVRRVTTKLKLRGIVLHSLRHMRITELFEMGWTEQEVMVVSGHTTSRMLARYTHKDVINKGVPCFNKLLLYFNKP